MSPPFATMLAGGDRRSIGAVAAALAALAQNPARLAELAACITAPDPLVRMRAADALEKWTVAYPADLTSYKQALLEQEWDDGTAEVRWHLHAMAARLALHDEEARGLFERFEGDVARHPSRIVRVMALQGAHDLASRHPVLRARFVALLDEAIRSPMPSLRARARMLARKMP